MRCERLGGERQRVGDVLVDGEALTRERDGGRDEVGEGELARPVFAPRELEASDGSGHADREPGIARLERIGLAVGVEEHVLGRRGRRGLAVVDRDRLIKIGAMDQHEAAAADVARARQGDGEREADRDRRIDGVAAALEHVQPDARRRRLLAHDHPMPGDDRASGGEGGDDGRLVGAGCGRKAKAKEGEGGEKREGLKGQVPWRRKRWAKHGAKSDVAVIADGSWRVQMTVMSLARGQSLPDRHDRAAREPRSELAHVGGGNRDAAGGGGEAGTREVEEDRAAAPLGAPRKILVEHEGQVIEMIVAPHPVGAIGGGQAHGAIVTRARRVLAPALVAAHGLQRHARGARPRTVRPVIAPQAA